MTWIPIQTCLSSISICWMAMIFLENNVKETNWYVEKIMPGVTVVWLAQCKKLTVHELTVFTGLLLHMGTICMNRLQDYWKKHKLCHFQCFGECMSMNWFINILCCLHFDNESSANRLQKICPLIDRFNIMNSIQWRR